jgi:uncharacterized protein involved in oxidation of intracellular sulfur
LVARFIRGKDLLFHSYRRVSREVLAKEVDCMEIVTMVVSSSPYGDERIWNALRLAEALSCSGAKMKVNIFLIGDAVNAAKKGQKPPKGFYNLEKMLADLVKIGATVNVCHTSMNLRGLAEEDLVAGARMGTITGLSKWIEKCQKVLSF